MTPAHTVNPHPLLIMPRFSINRTDEHSQPYPVWESDDLSEAWDQLDSLTATLEEARRPQSDQLEEVIRDLRGQIDEAEAESNVDAIAETLFPGG